MFERIALVGAGAVGASLAAMMMDAGVLVTIVADGERADALRARGLYVNGRQYRVTVEDRPNGGFDFVIVATKSTHLDAATGLVTGAAGTDGIVMSLLNGISSEDHFRSALAAAGRTTAPVNQRVVPAMILGIDAGRSDGVVTYLNRGTIHFGADPADAPVPETVLSAVASTLAAIGIPVSRSDDITRTLWWKFMINVGINQASAVLGATYGLFQKSEEARELMRSAMDEVIELSRLEGTGLTKDDVAAWLRTLQTLDPGGKTSMLQDVEHRRRTEVDLFAGTVIERARPHGLPVPVNRTLFRIIRALEASW